MSDRDISTTADTGERININNPRSVPVKVVISGFGCGAVIELGLSAGQFFTLVKGNSALSVEFRDITATEIQHPGAIPESIVPNQMH